MGRSDLPCMFYCRIQGIGLEVILGQLNFCPAQCWDGSLGGVREDNFHVVSLNTESKNCDRNRRKILTNNMKVGIRTRKEQISL